MCYAWDAMPGRPTTKPTPAFGARLAALRQERGWTQAQLAEKMGVSVKAVTYYEREVSSPNTRTLARIGQALGVEPAVLLGSPSVKHASRPGPAGKLQQVFERASKLPRDQQKHVVRVVEDTLTAYDVRKAG